MVVFKSSVGKVMLPLAVASFMVLEGCKKDEEVVPTQTDLLVGDWKMTESGGYSYTSSTSNYLFKFQRTGDAQFCYESTTTPADNYCYGGKWIWKDSNEKTIVIDQIVGNTDMELSLDIVLLDATKLEGELTSSYTYNNSTYSITKNTKFIKVK